MRQGRRTLRRCSRVPELTLHVEDGSFFLATGSAGHVVTATSSSVTPATINTARPSSSNVVTGCAATAKTTTGQRSLSAHSVVQGRSGVSACRRSGVMSRQCCLCMTTQNQDQFPQPAYVSVSVSAGTACSKRARQTGNGRQGGNQAEVRRLPTRTTVWGPALDVSEDAVGEPWPLLT